MRKNRQIQVKDILRQQAEAESRLDPYQPEPAGQDPDYPKSAWWREEVHGRSAMLERQRLRSSLLINRPKRGARCGFKDYEHWRAQQP